MGDSELRSAVAAQLSTLGGGEFRGDDVLITNGAASGIYSSMVAYLDPGDEVLLHDPTYSLYADVALTIGAVPVFVRWDPELRLDMAALERAVTPKTRMLVINNPVNPTGIVLTAAEMQRVADFVRRHDLMLISDEAYDHLVYDNREMISAARFADLADRTIVINTCSKTFAMTGWRVGYAAGRASLIRPIGVIHRTTVNNINSMAMRAAVAAFTIETDWQRRMLTEYAARRDTMCAMVNAMPGLSCARPEGAFYVFVRVNVPMSSEALTAHCLQHGVAVRSGTEFGPHGGEGFIRLTFAGEPKDFKPGLERLDKAMRAL
jgi:aspartate aminotransferase